MIVTSLARALAHALLDAAIADETARRAAKGGVDAGLAPAALALGDVAGAVQAGVGAVGKVAHAAAGGDDDVARALDFVESEAGRLASGDFAAALLESAAEKAVGGAGGGVAEAASRGEAKVMDGLSLSSGLAKGLVGHEKLTEALSERSLRVGVGLGGGAGAAAMADPEHQADAFRYGAQLGFRLDSLRLEAGAFERALGAAEIATEWAVAVGARVDAPTRSWTESLAFGRGVARSGVDLAAGVRSLAAPELTAPGDERAEADGRARAAATPSAREERAAGIATLAGGAARLAAEIAAFAAQHSAEARARRAAATGDEHLRRGAGIERQQAADLSRYRAAAESASRAAPAIRSDVPVRPGPRTDGPSEADRQT